MPKSRRVQIVMSFCEDIPASQTARLNLVNRKTVNAWYAEIRGRLLPSVSQLDELPQPGSFLAYHKRRISRFNGLSKKSGKLFLLESRLRYQLKDRFRSLVIELASDLIA